MDCSQLILVAMYQLFHLHLPHRPSLQRDLIIQEELVLVVMSFRMENLQLIILLMPGYLNLHHFLGISNRAWITCHQWPPFQNKSCNLLHHSSLPRLLKSLVQTARSHFRKGRLLISGKGPLICFVPLLAYHPFHRNQLQRSSALCAKKILQQ